jgi:uncharacterized protein (DUF1697 family)
MKELRVLFEEHGCSDVQTYIQSGNVVFRSGMADRAKLARRLERAVEETFGASAVVVLRTFEEIGKVARSHPFGADTSKSHVAFLAEKPKREGVRSLEELDIAPDQVKVVGSDVFLRFPNGMQGARLSGALLERHLGVRATMRNWKTVDRLAEMTH